MTAKLRRQSGFTLIELMVTLAVVVILLLIAVPSFQVYRQRAAVRSASEQVLGLWQQARFEAAKRNTFVRFGIVTSGSNICIGAATQGLVGGATPTAANTTTCDCTGADATNLCDIFVFPANQSEWRNAAMVGTPTLGGNTGRVVLEPKNALITASGNAGAITFAAPPGPRTYRINFRVDSMGRGVLCQSSGSDPLSDYSGRVCSP